MCLGKKGNIDISDKAIQLTPKKAQDKNINIEYVCDDIFKFKNTKNYDVIIILYKTYATFSKDERKNLLNKVYDLLTYKGLLLFDAPLIEEFNNYNEMNVWTTLKDNDAITKYSKPSFNKKYPNNILLSNTIYLTENNDIFSVNDWLKFYSENKSNEIYMSRTCSKCQIRRNVWQDDLDIVKNIRFVDTFKNNINCEVKK